MKKSIFISVCVAVFALLWVGSGLIGSGQDDTPPPQNAAAQDQDDESDVPRVRVMESTAKLYEYDIQLTGRTQASRNVVLRAEIEGQIEEILFEEGTAVKQGDVIARLEERDRAARLAEAKQRLSQREIEFNAASRLAQQGFNSKVRKAQSRADLEAARAAVAEAEIDLANLEIKAPFDGILFDQMIEVGDLVRVGDMLFSITDLDPIEVNAFASEKQITYLQTGQKARAIFLNNAQTEGQVTYLSPVADPSTRTFPTKVSFSNPENTILQGQTVRVLIPAKAEKVHKITPAILTLDNDGIVGVKTVDSENKVAFKPVRIVSDKPDSMLVGGLPDNVTIITVGQDFVTNGQIVTPVPETEKASGAL